MENIIIWGLYWFIGKFTPYSIWKLIGCIVLSIVLVIITFRVLFTSNYRKSEVDVSPIAELNSNQVYKLNDVVERFIDYDFITRCDIEEKSEDHYLSKTCSMYWKSEDLATILDISVFFYRDEQRAVNSMELDRDGRYSQISYDNNTEALLFDSKMIRTSDTLYSSSSERYIKSKIRLGNSVITLSESQEYYNLDRNISTEFIKLLCEMLSHGK